MFYQRRWPDYADAPPESCARNPSGRHCRRKKTQPMPAEAFLAIVVALAVSIVLAMCLPTWAALAIAAAAVACVAIGGGALLAKVSIVGGLLALSAFAVRTYLRRRAAKRMAAEVKWVAIPEMPKRQSRAPAPRSERRAA